MSLLDNLSFDTSLPEGAAYMGGPSNEGSSDGWMNILKNLGGNLGLTGKSTPALLSTLSSIYGLFGANKLQSMADSAFGQANPFGAYRPMYAQQLQQLMADPSSIKNTPGYQFQMDEGTQAINRRMAASGFKGSGNEAIALQKYGQDYAASSYDKELQRLMILSGANINPANASTGLVGMNSGLDLAGQALASLGYGVTRSNGKTGFEAAGGAAADISKIAKIADRTSNGYSNDGVAGAARSALGLGASSAPEISYTVGADGFTNPVMGAIDQTGFRQANAAVDAANPSTLSTIGNIAGGVAGAYNLVEGVQNGNPTQGLSGGAGVANAFGMSSIASGLGAGAIAFGIAGIGNYLLGNDDPYVLDPSSGVTYNPDNTTASLGNFSAQFNPLMGLMMNTNGTSYNDASGKAWSIPLLNGRTGNTSRMVYDYLTKQGAKLPSLQDFMSEWDSFAASAHN